MRDVSAALQAKINAKIQTLSAESDPKAVVSLPVQMSISESDVFKFDFRTGGSLNWSYTSANFALENPIGANRFDILAWGPMTGQAGRYPNRSIYRSNSFASVKSISTDPLISTPGSDYDNYCIDTAGHDNDSRSGGATLHFYGTYIPGSDGFYVFKTVPISQTTSTIKIASSIGEYPSRYGISINTKPLDPSGTTNYIYTDTVSTLINSGAVGCVPPILNVDIGSYTVFLYWVGKQVIDGVQKLITKIYSISIINFEIQDPQLIFEKIHDDGSPDGWIYSTQCQVTTIKNKVYITYSYRVRPHNSGDYYIYYSWIIESEPLVNLWNGEITFREENIRRVRTEKVSGDISEASIGLIRETADGHSYAVDWIGSVVYYREYKSTIYENDQRIDIYKERNSVGPAISSSIYDPTVIAYGGSWIGVANMVVFLGM